MQTFFSHVPSTGFSGVNVKAFPKEADHGAIVELLVAAGLPEAKKDDINIKLNGTVTITNLDNDVSSQLISYLHNMKFMGKKIFCNGIVPLTPKKQEDLTDPSPSSNLTEPDAASHVQLSVGPSDYDPLKPNQNLLVTPDVLVRRNSLSMRSPPNGSLAAEILGTPSHPTTDTLGRRKSLLADLKEIREMSERLSEFGSCRSSSSSESESESKNEIEDGFKTMNEKKRGWKNKRKLSLTPNKDSLLKKQK